MDTIYALATARGKSGVAIVRVSGPGAGPALTLLAGGIPQPRQTSLRRIRDRRGDSIDQGLVIFFDKNQSFTGEEVAEFHIHGSIAAARALLDALAGIDGLRMAEPGEFTRRALMNGRMDLTEVEGLGALIEAETETQRKQALRMFQGALSGKAEAWRAGLLRARALLEATIDFADEEVPVDVTPEVRAVLADLAQDFDREIAGFASAERIREGFEVAIVGAPNVGKSTLLNALAGRQAALTSEIAGTTRDVIEVRMDIHGLPVTMLDTAGLRDTNDQIEAAGVRLARDRASAADLRVFLLPGDRAAPDMPPRPGDIVLVAKADVYNGTQPAVSGRSGQGIGALLQRVSAELSGRAAGASLIAHARQEQAVRAALAEVAAARAGLSSGAADEVTAFHLLTAAQAMERLLGRVDIEDVLGEIFASFCIGK